MNSKNPPRKYDSTRRKEQARATRLQIAQSARQLFLERGYAGATIEAIADGAGVAKETVYAAFRNKQRLLAFVFDISVGGDDAPLSMMERADPQAVLHETDQRRQLTMFAQGISEIHSRAASVFEIIRVASKTEPEIARRLKRLYQERFHNMTMVAESIAANGPLRAELDVHQAAETIWGLSSPELYTLMAQYRGWSQQRYAEWLAASLQRLLLP